MSDNPYASPPISNDSPDEADSSSLGLLQPLAEVTIWSKILAGSLIASGIGFALSIVGLIIAWLPILSGVFLWQHANRLHEARRLQDTKAMQESIEKLATSIKLAAIFMAIMIALYVLYILVIIVVVFVGLLNS
ncbi:MAG: DUF5362 domain-containing protein [Blastopirellula sp. JB062]